MPLRSLAELVNTTEPSWPLVQEWIAKSRHRVEVFRAEQSRGSETLLRLQVTTRSPLGSIALETAGIFVDHRWLRILGAGGEHVHDGLLYWNNLGEESLPEAIERALVIAHDAIGGFFVSNGGQFSGQPGSTYYFAPGTLQWKNLHLSYSAFVSWALKGDLAQFYAGVRWPNWEHEVAALTGDQGFSIYPFLWAEGEPVANRSRRAVPMRELWGLHRDLARQVDRAPTAAPSS